MSARRFTIVDGINLVLRIFLGGFYLIAGGLKVSDPGKFAESVANYRLLPHELINVVAITLPWIEVAAGLFLIFGLWKVASAWLINLMTVVFIAAIASAVSRGLNVECGCFGTVGGRRVGLTAIAEDSFLLLCGLWLIWKWQSRNVPAEPPAPAGVEVPSPTEG
jgi:putative oxidoreductase